MLEDVESLEEVWGRIIEMSSAIENKEKLVD